MSDDKWETKGSFEEEVELSSLDNIKAEGISIRVGGQIVKFVADEVQDIPVVDEIRNEMKQMYEEEVKRLQDSVQHLKDSVKSQVSNRNYELDQREKELNKKLRENVSLPTITEDQMKSGLTVARRKSNRGGYVWSFICVYAPKYVNEKIIDPNFAKRLMTPIRILIYTDDNWKSSEVRLVKLINCEKFEHYHLSGSSDCWGEFKQSGTLVDTPEKAIDFYRTIQIVLETINQMSIGTSSPKGLSRFTTIEKHLLKDRPDLPKKKKSTAASKRNDRAGFDESVNDNASEEVWSV